VRNIIAINKALKVETAIDEGLRATVEARVAAGSMRYEP
jgi:hypothetical protein